MSEDAYIRFVTEHAGDDPQRLLLAADRWPGVDVRRAARNIAARARIRTKIPSWYAHPELEYPGSLPLEQASSEATALYKQQFVPAGARIADLTGGLGVDCWFLSQGAAQAHYCELKSELVAAARHNFAALGRADIEIHEGSGPQWLREQSETFDLIYLDPARRGAGQRRVYDISDCEPNLLEIKDMLLAKSSRTLAKISPMADISRTLEQFPETRQLHVVAVAGEVKELLLLLEASGESGPLLQGASTAAPQPEPLIVAHDILGGGAHHFEFRPSEEPAAEVRYAGRIGKFLFQPSKAVLKAGAFRLLSERFGLEKLAPSTHLYTADTIPEGFPGKVFEVETTFDWSKDALRCLKQSYDRMEMTALNFPLATDELRKKTGIAGGGSRHLFATTLADKSKKLIICRF